MASGSIVLENVVLKLGLITTQEEGSTDVVLYRRIPCQNLDLTDRNSTTAVISLKKSAILMLNDIENDMNYIDDLDSVVELTYNDNDNDRIQIMTNDDIIDSLECCCCATKTDNNEMMSIKIFAKVSKVLLSQQKQQNQYLLLSSYEENSDIMVEKWQNDKYTPQRREMIHHIVKPLKKDHKHNTSDSTSKIPQMEKQLEVSLYRDAPTFEGYTDMSTLKQRLQQHLSSSSECIDIVDWQDLVEGSDFVAIEDSKYVQDQFLHDTRNLYSSKTEASSRNSEEWRLRIRSSRRPPPPQQQPQQQPMQEQQRLRSVPSFRHYQVSKLMEQRSQIEQLMINLDHNNDFNDEQYVVNTEMIPRSSVNGDFINWDLIVDGSDLVTIEDRQFVPDILFLAYALMKTRPIAQEEYNIHQSTNSTECTMAMCCKYCNGIDQDNGQYFGIARNGEYIRLSLNSLLNARMNTSWDDSMAHHCRHYCSSCPDHTTGKEDTIVRFTYHNI